MLIDITTVEDAVKFAIRIARKMSNDPEVDSLAGEAAWRALYTYDERRGVKLSWWIAQLAKQSVQYYWRRIAKLREREKFMDELWWKEQSKLGRIGSRAEHYEEDNKLLRSANADEQELDISRDDWQLLVESLIQKWPLDVIARERGISLHQARKLRNAAIARLEAAC